MILSRHHFKNRRRLAGQITKEVNVELPPHCCLNGSTCICAFSSFLPRNCGPVVIDREEDGGNVIQRGNFSNQLFKHNFGVQILKIYVIWLFNPILDGVRAYPILDGGGGGAKKPPRLTLPFSV